MGYFANDIGSKVRVKTEIDGVKLNFVGIVKAHKNGRYFVDYKGEEIMVFPGELRPVARNLMERVCYAFGHKTPTKNYSCGTHNYPYRAFVGYCPRCGQRITWDSKNKPLTIKQIV